MSEVPVYLSGAARTPIGKFGGSLSSLTAPQLGSAAARAAMGRSGLLPDQIHETIFGCARQAGAGPNPGRQVTHFAASRNPGSTSSWRLPGSGLR